MFIEFHDWLTFFSMRIKFVIYFKNSLKISFYAKHILSLQLIIRLRVSIRGNQFHFYCNEFLADLIEKYLISEILNNIRNVINVLFS